MKKKTLIAILIFAVTVLAVGCSNSSEVSSTLPPAETTTPPLEEPSDTAVNIEEPVTPEYDTETLNEYMASVTEQSDLIKASLEQDPLNQHEMNAKSQELYELWDGALNYLWDKLKNSMPEDEFSVLLDEQLVWIAEKENSVEEAGIEFEGGSIYLLIVNMKAAEITESRVYELYDLLTNN